MLTLTAEVSAGLVTLLKNKFYFYCIYYLYYIYYFYCWKL